MPRPRELFIRIVGRLGRPRTVLILAVLEVALLGSVNGLDFPLSVPYLQRLTGHPYLDVCGFCSADAVRNELTGLGERGRLLQALLYATFDLLIPTLSCILGIAALAALTKSWRTRTRLTCWLFALPVLAMLLDFTENGTVIALLIHYPADAPTLGGLAGLLTGLKFTAYGASTLTVLILLIARALARLRGPRQPQKLD